MVCLRIQASTDEQGKLLARTAHQIRTLRRLRESDGVGRSSSPQTVSARWLLGAIGGVIAAAALCAWGALCLMFWQGSWQLLYHPQATVARTPANVGLAFDDLGFAATEAGLPRLHGWWIPAAPGARYSRYTALYLHGASWQPRRHGRRIARLHGAGSTFRLRLPRLRTEPALQPSEAHWREDAESALQYLDRHTPRPRRFLVLFGQGLGANLALEIAAAHPDWPAWSWMNRCARR